MCIGLAGRGGSATLERPSPSLIWTATPSWLGHWSGFCRGRNKKFLGGWKNSRHGQWIVAQEDSVANSMEEVAYERAPITAAATMVTPMRLSTMRSRGNGHSG